ncbi:MAG: hypothetical protein RR992_06565, partial [Clostridiales bacterium]
MGFGVDAGGGVDTGGGVGVGVGVASGTAAGCSCLAGGAFSSATGSASSAQARLNIGVELNNI